MTILDKKSLEMVKNNPKCSFNELTVGTKNKLWKIFRTESSAIDELKELVGGEKCQEWAEQAKQENKDYYALDFFRDKNNDTIVLRELLKNIYINFIINNDSRFVIKEITGQLTKDNLFTIADILQNITSFCIESNYSSNYVEDIFMEFYDIVPEISRGVKELYDQNKLSLKLDYLINNIQESNHE